MAVLVTCKFDDDTIKEIFKFKSVKFSSLKGKQLQNEWSESAQIELHQAFMPVLVTSNFYDDLIKNE